MPAGDPFDLDRFVTAQEGVFETALAELRAGRKRTHWMWFVFPQLRGLGHSPTAQHFGIASLEEARAYLSHALLGPRVTEATEAVLGVTGCSLHQIFGSPDDMKFRSSMTLFERAAAEGGGGPFARALDQWCGGERDPKTHAMLGRTLSKS
ncbi:DUF1810 domain-containing protein [Aurantimonas sp. VKM B-3413]|uniref:DUF1810 domain-containing protein n=1 Tax=Aurantimonas sp. VKM B-3413 TaxID=2779401 RepID=UPI001E3F6A19|nr:DUF1810 domain-containing protein [Aurantimonas sp. VKM B-3413]MCB8837039.1 DUF1810 domain-containing protein [Aurantimonas sp. VKM B-3413]